MGYFLFIREPGGVKWVLRFTAPLRVNIIDYINGMEIKDVIPEFLLIQGEELEVGSNISFTIDGGDESLDTDLVVKEE